MKRVLGVHGIGNYHYFRKNGRLATAAADAIGAAWSGWLSRGLGLDTDLRLAYYAHHLHRGTPQGGDDPMLLEPEAQEMLVSWVELLQPQPQVAQGQRTARLRQAIDWLTRRYGPAARGLAATFFREVHTYLKDPDSVRRQQVRQTVMSALADHRPDVVIAHSLGSVIAYETLWEHPEYSVELLVTIGSPLAMPGVVFNRLSPAVVANRGARPPSVANWLNLADVGDIIAVPREGLSLYFDGVARDEQTTIGKWDFHTAKGYLSCPDLGRVLSSAGVL